MLDVKFLLYELLYSLHWTWIKVPSKPNKYHILAASTNSELIDFLSYLSK